MTFELLIVCRIGDFLDDIKELLNEKLSQVMVDNLVELDSSIIGSLIQINYLRECETISTTPEEIKRNILGISVEIPEEVENTEIIIEEFCYIIAEDELIEHVVKFEDESLFEKNRKFFHEIFYIEMKLRRIITMIYLHQYSDNYFKLLRDEITKSTSKDPPTEDQMKNSFENEFFHLLFNQYINLNNRKLPSKIDDFINLIKERNSYEDFLNELNRSPITNSDDKDFLASLKDKLEPIEKVRNCVAHNRKISDRILQDYHNAKTLLESELDQYLSKYSLIT